MEWWQSIALALLQGLTEFLPISSSAHLILVPHLTGWQDQGLAFDVAVHVGTLGAVMLYFRADIRAMASAWLDSITRGVHSADSRLAWGVLLGTIPVGLAGLVFKSGIEAYLRTPLVIAITTLLFGLLLWWADARGKRQRSEHAMTWRDIAIIGCAQALALIPGTSRSGITITAGLMVGLTREGAARFSFLLSIPVIALAGGLEGLELLHLGLDAPWSSLAIGLTVALISAYLTIHLFLKLLERIGLLPFAIYRLILGALLLWLYI